MEYFQNVSLLEVKNYLKTKANLLIFFNCEWCGQSKMQKLVFDRYLEKPSSNDWTLVTVDLDHNSLWSDQNQLFKITICPSLVAFSNQTELTRCNDFLSLSAFEDFIKPLPTV